MIDDPAVVLLCVRNAEKLEEVPLSICGEVELGPVGNELDDVTLERMRALGYVE